MLQSRDNGEHRARDAQAVSGTAVVVSAVAILSISAATAWLLQSGVGQATAQAGTQLAARVPEDASPPLAGDAGFAHDPSRIIQPRVGQITLEVGMPTLVDGIGQPLAALVLSSNGQVIGQTAAKADGTWRMSIERGLGRGDHRLHVRMVTAGGRETFSDMVRVSTPQGFVGPLVVSFGGGETMAAAASLADGSGRPVDRVVRVAEVTPTTGSVADGAVGAVRDWFERADRNYRDVVVKRLSAAGDAVPVGKSAATATAIAQAQTPPVAAAPKTAPAEPPGAGVVDGVLNWLKRSSDTYQKAIIKRLAEPTPSLDSIEAKAKADEAKKAADAKTGEDAQQKAREELRAAQAKRDADLKAAEVASQKATTEAAAKAPAAAAKVEDEATRKAADDKRIADETIRRLADLKAADEKRVADQKAADDKRVADEAAKRAADLKAADVKKAADEAAMRDVAARKAAEDERVADEAARRTAEVKAAEAKKAADDVRLAQEAAQRAAAEAKKAADMARDAEAKRQADLRAADDARQAAAKASNQQADAARAAAAKAAEDVRKRGADLAEAASREATARIAAQPAVPPKAPEPKRTSIAQQQPKPAAKAVPERVARVAPPPVRRGPAIDTSTRSALGAGSGVRGVARKPDEASDDSCRKAGRRIKPPGYYVVGDGDSLWDIADLHYGDGNRFQIIERANRRLGDPDLIKPCQRLFIPAPKRG